MFDLFLHLSVGCLFLLILSIKKQLKTMDNDLQKEMIVVEILIDDVDKLQDIVFNRSMSDRSIIVKRSDSKSKSRYFDYLNPPPVPPEKE